MSAAFPTGIPNIFTSPMTAFPLQGLFHSSGRQTESGVSFTNGDRLMLQLLYQQQQAIHIQLQSMTLLIQQLQMSLAGLSKHTTAIGGYGVPAAADTDATLLSNAPVPELKPTQLPANNIVDAAAAPSPEVVKSDGRKDKNEVTESNSAHVPHTKEISPSCTPPSEDLNFSRHSATNRSLESAPPWDPAAAGSRQSSAMRSVRAENPLLSSLRGKLPTPNRSTGASVSAGTGYSASANLSASIDEKKPLIRPARRSFSSSSLSVDPEVKEISASSRQCTQSSQKQQLQQQRVVLDNRKVGSLRQSSSSAGTAIKTKEKNFSHPPFVKEWSLVDNHQNHYVGNGKGDTNVSAAGYESESDGYGSYETRQYLKSVGII